MKKSIKSIKVFNIKTLRVFIFSFLIIFFFRFGYAQQVNQIEYNKEKIIMEVCKKKETIYSSIESPSWQGKEIEPDIEVDEDSALHIAHKEFIKFKLLTSKSIQCSFWLS